MRESSSYTPPTRQEFPVELLMPLVNRWYQDQERNLEQEMGDADERTAKQAGRFIAYIRERSRKR